MARTVVTKTKPNLSINYTAYPTARAFHASDAFIRAILGPIGCYSGDTEYLTPSGWKRFDAYDGGVVAQHDFVTGTMSFVEPERYIVEPCDTMLRFHNEHALDMVLSDEHRMPLYQFDGKLVVKLAEHVAKKPSRHTVPSTFRVPHAGLPFTEAQTRVMVMVHADGYMPKAGSNKGKCLVQVHKERKAERAMALLDAAGIAYTTDVRVREDRNNTIVTTLTFTPPARTKDYAAWWTASQSQLETVVDEIQYWDGLFEGEDRRFHTSIRGDADFVQYAVHACGGRATIKWEHQDKFNAKRVDRDTTNWNRHYTVHIALDSAKAKVMLRGDSTTIERVPALGGRKYCFTVPTGFLVVRHNNRVFISGNSGKSSATWMELFRRACDEWPDADGVRSSMHLCVRDTYAMLKETTLADFKSWFGKIADVVMDSPIRASVRMPLPDGTTLDWNLRFLSMDGGDKSLNALRGMQISAAYVNEGHSIPKEVYEVIATRIGRYRPAGRDPKWKGIITDSNYGYQGCYLHQLYMNPPDTVAFFEQPHAALWNPMTNKWQLNPNCDNLVHLPGGMDYYAKLLKMSNEFVKQFLGNQWAVKTTGKQVYPEFSPQMHIIRGVMQPDRNLPLIVGMDFGLHVACSMFQLSPQGKLVQFKELWDDDADLEGFVARRLVPTLRNEFTGIRAIVCGDPAGVGRSHLDKRTAFSVLKAAGLDAHPAVTNDPTRRIGSVKYFLTRQNGFGVHHTCTRSIEGMEGGYGYRKRSDGSYADDPEKNEWSHIADSQQYAALFARYGSKKDVDPYAHAREMRKQNVQHPTLHDAGFFYA